MGWLNRFFTYSIGKKLIMALTGLFLIIFLLVHLAGNLLLFAGQDIYNEYAAGMAKGPLFGMNPIIFIIRIVLFAGILFHIIDALIITKINRAARPVGYAEFTPASRSSWASRNMGITGSIIFIFLVIHLRAFFVENTFIGTDNLHGIVVSAFQNPIYSAFYVLAMVLLAFHLSHGFTSAFQTLGLRHVKYSSTLDTLGKGFSILVPLGFASIPIYFFLSQYF